MCKRFLELVDCRLGGRRCYCHRVVLVDSGCMTCWKERTKGRSVSLIE